MGLNLIPVPASPGLEGVGTAEVSETSAAVFGKVVPGENVVATYSADVEYASETEYKALTRVNPSAPYSHKAPVVANITIGHHGVNLAKIAGLTQNTGYDYRVVLTETVTGSGATATTKTANMSFRTVTRRPETTTLPASSVNSLGAVLNGRIDDYGASVPYSFRWAATYSGTGCSSGTEIAEGVLRGGTLRAHEGTQEISLPLNFTGANALPEGTLVRYYLEIGSEAWAVTPYFAPTHFTTGSLTPGGGGQVDVVSANTAVLQDFMPTLTEPTQQFPPETGYYGEKYDLTFDGLNAKQLDRIAFDGDGAPQYGMYEFEEADNERPHPERTGSTKLVRKCGTAVTSTLTGLYPATTYDYTPIATHGRGVCPYLAEASAYFELRYYVLVYYGTPYCSRNDEVGGPYGQFTSSTEYGNPPQPPPSEPAFSPEFSPGEIGYGPQYDPTFYPAQAFETAAVSEPAQPSVGTGNGSASDGLGCEAHATCSGKQTIVYAVAAAGAAGATAQLHEKTIVLGSVKFKIPAGKKRKIHFHLTPSGLRYLKAHPRILTLELVTSVRAGKGKAVTLTNIVGLGRRTIRELKTHKHKK